MKPRKPPTRWPTATQNMSLAEGHLGAGKPNEAATQQQKAAESMGKARAALDAQKQKLLDELDKSGPPAGGGQSAGDAGPPEECPRRQRGGCNEVRRPTAPPPTAISSSASASSARPSWASSASATKPKISSSRPNSAWPSPRRSPICTTACSRWPTAWDGGTANAATGVRREENRDPNLADLLDTFKQLAGQPSDDPSNCRGCKGNTNKLLAELRTLRVVQARVTKETDLARAAPARGLCTRIGRARSATNARRQACRIFSNNGASGFPQQMTNGRRTTAHISIVSGFAKMANNRADGQIRFVTTCSQANAR